MSVLLVLLMFALVMILGHLLKRGAQLSATVRAETARRVRPLIESNFGMDAPRGYCFHPCHTWAVDEGGQLIRVGVDKFAVNLFGRIEHIDVAGLYRWVRQGQKLMTITLGGISVDLPSPVEGTVTAVNRAALENPELIATDPFCEGWIAVIKSQCFDTDRKNLMHEAMAAQWMRDSFVALREMCSRSPALAQDGGPALSGLLNRVSPELRNRLVKEFFLTVPVVPAQPTNQAA
ncbi:MAG: glycine cleavage system protein H [Acidobacteriia bacterium]|nr:glycine cleavage system protein H [Terriglobia bacterium]